MSRFLLLSLSILLLLSFYLIGKANYLILISGIITPEEHMIVGLSLMFVASASFNALRNKK
jgi:hypothetical protein